MSVSSVGSTSNSTSASSNTSSSSSANSLASTNAFLTLLIAQLKNQDPLDAMSTNEFMNELSALTTTQQMTNMSNSVQNSMTNINNLYATNLIGKKIQYTAADNSTQSATVTQVTIKNGNPSLVLDNGSTINLSSVVSVS
ncbi:flagellar hook capping protein [Thermodesulfobium narugense DSM 14796]|uniref:Basal-body rod modification protein FlgD n=1 Tax=Thermodesulfobium narugense DSM 14796 TaxID=747365 RepID=M1E7U4_9BACT|nr:flagellar hook capping FlgD N-terminal domain-containing protein [Thermodesulfobium narugense]AEE15421.1 flagellar hook capping protein [Thermodesulfobium narugense DSM 14796]